MKSKISNSKYKNVGILFELLVRQVTSDTISGKQSSRAIDIMTKYFNANTELGKELQLYRAFFDVNKLTESRAIHFIDLIVQQRKKLDERKLSMEKYNLIKEIKDNYPLKEFLACRIKDYTVYASIYKTFLHECFENKDSIANVTDLTKARFTLIESLTGERQKINKIKNDEVLSELKTQSEDLRLLTYKLVVEKFNARYSGLNDRQKTLLREYINNMAGSPKFTRFVREEISTTRAEITELLKKETNPVLKIKINEVASRMDKMGTAKNITDTEITALMIAYEIIKELKNVA